MEVVTVAAVGLAVLCLALAGVAVHFWSAHRKILAHAHALEEEVEAVREQNTALHGAFDLYRQSHLQLIEAVRPRVLDDKQRYGLRLHTRDLGGTRIRIKVAADTEPSLYAADLCNALITAGMLAEIDPSRDSKIGEKGVESTIEMAAGNRARLLRAALKSFAYPMTERGLTVARVRRGGGDPEEPEVVITVGSRPLPPELMDLPPPPKPPPVKPAGPRIRGASSPMGGPGPSME